MKITVEFLGGLDASFGNQRKHVIQNDDIKTAGDLVTLIAATMMEPENTGEFIENGTIRPGILALINDTDWELEGAEEYELENNDVVSFTSTLHGG